MKLLYISHKLGSQPTLTQQHACRSIDNYINHYYVTVFLTDFTTLYPRYKWEKTIYLIYDAARKSAKGYRTSAYMIDFHKQGLSIRMLLSIEMYFYSIQHASVIIFLYVSFDLL